LQTTYLHEYLEGLNSSLAQYDGELLPGVKFTPVAFETAKILVNVWFMSHKFSSRYAGKLLKGSKDSYSSQDSNKILSPKNVPLRRRPGPGKDGQNNAKIPLLVTFPPEKLIPKTKTIFFYLQFKTCRIRWGFEQLSSSIAWQVMALQIFFKLQRKCPMWDLKGQRSRTGGSFNGVRRKFPRGAKA